FRPLRVRIRQSSACAKVPLYPQVFAIRREFFDMKIRELFYIAASVAISCLTAGPAFGQAASAAINGTVLDASSSVVPDADVVVQNEIDNMPINGRRVDAFVLLSPGVTNDATFGLLTFRGNAGGNSFLTDGIDTTNTFYDENAGRTRSYNISQDAVQEFQVV